MLLSFCYFPSFCDPDRVIVQTLGLGKSPLIVTVTSMIASRILRRPIMGSESEPPKSVQKACLCPYGVTA